MHKLNTSGLPFNPNMKEKDYEKLESLAQNAFKGIADSDFQGLRRTLFLFYQNISIPGQSSFLKIFFLEKVQLVISTLGTYHPLKGMDDKVQKSLLDQHFLFKEGDRFLKVWTVQFE